MRKLSHKNVLVGDLLSAHDVTVGSVLNLCGLNFSSLGKGYWASSNVLPSMTLRDALKKGHKVAATFLLCQI